MSTMVISRAEWKAQDWGISKAAKDRCCLQK